MKLLPRFALEEVSIAVITATKSEYVAACKVLRLAQRVPVPLNANRIGGRIGAVRHIWDGEHVVLAIRLADMGNSSSAILSTVLQAACPRLTQLLMCGIAGGMPDIRQAENHVRLGDIVVSQGVWQYDRGRENLSAFQASVKDAPLPSFQFLEAHRGLQEDSEGGDRTWENYIEKYGEELGPSWKRPERKLDILAEPPAIVSGIFERFNLEVPSFLVFKWTHPKDIERDASSSRPRVFAGRVASANRVQRNVNSRREIQQQKPDVRAVEMEASGIADACWHLGGLQYMIVRGVCDYCNQGKNDIWHKYASLVAACYTRSLLERLLPAHRRRATEVQVPETFALVEWGTATPPLPEIAVDFAIAGGGPQSTLSGVELTQQPQGASTGNASPISLGTVESVDSSVTSEEVTKGVVSIRESLQAEVTVSEVALALTEDIQESRKKLDFAAERAAVAALEGHVEANRAQIDKEVLVKCYGELAQVAVIKARTSGAADRLRHLATARKRIEEARNAAQR